MLILNKRLDYVYLTCLPLILTMNPHLHLGRWWPIVFPPSGSLVATRKYVSSYQYTVCCRINQSLVVHQDTSGKIDTWKFTQGSNRYCYQTKVINCSYMILRVRHQKMIGGVRIALPQHGSNQLCVCLSQTWIFFVRECHGILEAQAGFLDRHCT